MLDVWKNVLKEIEQNIPASAFNTWFTGVQIHSIKDGIVTIDVPNVFKESQIRTKYDQTIRDALLKNSIDFTDVQYSLSSSNTNKSHSREISLKTLKDQNSQTIIRKSIKQQPNSQSFHSSGLNPNYTMANFVVTSSNEVAISVAQAVIKNLGTKYNPFFLYGGPGLGKTHLVQAIGNEVAHNFPELKVLYTPTNLFYSEFIDSIRNSSKKGVDISDFNRKYTNVDVLIVDDFQMIINKEASQTAFFDVFNDLYQRGKQIIITCDRLPDQLEALDSRLSSRLKWSGAYDLQMPNFEDKCAILRAKSEFDEVEIEDEAIEYIANNVKTNIRDLEGEYKKILAYADFKHTTPLKIIESGMVDFSSSKKVNLTTPQKLIEVVANFYNITADELKSKSRVAHIKNARQVAMYLLNEELGLSTTRTAIEAGVKDHTTAMHAIKKIKNSLNDDFSLRDQITKIRSSLYE